MASIDSVLPTPGAPGATGTIDPSTLYVTPAELEALTGMQCGEEPLRYAQTLYDSACNRKSLWPSEYTETLRLPVGGQSVRLSVSPFLRLLACAGSYGGRRRGGAASYAMDWYLVAGLATGGPAWTPIPAKGMDLDTTTGELWLTAGQYMAAYSAVRVRYLAGFPQIPGPVKLHIADIVHNIQQRGLSTRTRYQVGRIVSQYASSTFLSPDVREGMQPYVVRAMA